MTGVIALEPESGARPRLPRKSHPSSQTAADSGARNGREKHAISWRDGCLPPGNRSARTIPPARPRRRGTWLDDASAKCLRGTTPPAGYAALVLLSRISIDIKTAPSTPAGEAFPALLIHPAAVATVWWPPPAARPASKDSFFPPTPAPATGRLPAT